MTVVAVLLKSLPNRWVAQRAWDTSTAWGQERIEDGTKTARCRRSSRKTKSFSPMQLDVFHALREKSTETLSK